MASPKDVEVCATIERHLKALLMPGSSPKEETTPKKGNARNKTYEEDFPILVSGTSPGTSSNMGRSTKSPGKFKQAHSGNQHTPSARLKDVQEVNGYSYFQGKELVDFKPDRSFRNSQTQGCAKSPRNSFTEDSTRGAMGKTIVESGENLKSGPHQENRVLPLPEGPTVKQRKKQKRREKKQQVRQEPEPKPAMANLTVVETVNEVPVAEKPQSQNVEAEKDVKKIKSNKGDKAKGKESEMVHQRLKNEIIRERQRMNDNERKYHQEYLDYRLAHIDDQLKKYLETEYLFFLKKPSARFPDALFLCHLCNYHCDIDNFDRHIKQANHVSMKNIRANENFLQNLPYPSESQCSALTSLLENVASEHGLCPEEQQQRQEVADRLTKLIQDNGLPECKLQVYGSSLSGFGIKGSDLNLDLIYASLETLPGILCKLQVILKECEHLCDMDTDFDAKMPKILFHDKLTNLDCNISWSNVGTVQTSRLLARYKDLDPRAGVLGVAFKLWAKMCGIDCQEKGTLPAHCYTIMLVYFLQQTKPAVLPVLAEVDQKVDQPSKSGKTKKWTCRNKQSIGALWIELFRFYGVTFKVAELVVCIRFKKPVTRVEKKWSGKVIAIEDPYCRKRNLSRCIPNQVIYRFIQERFRSAYKYFGVPQLLSTGRPLFEQLAPEILKVARKGRPQYAMLESEDSQDEDDDDDEEEDSEHKKDESPLRERDLLDNIKGRLFDDHDSSSSDEDLLHEQDPELSMDDVKRTLALLDLGESGDGRKYRTESESSDVCPPSVDTEASIGKTESTPSSKKSSEANKNDEKVDRKRPETPPCPLILELMTSFPGNDLNFKFDKKILTNGKIPPIYCGMCGLEGHLKDDCPTQILPNLVDLPELSPEYLKDMSHVCEQIMRDHAPLRKEIEDREALLADLQKHIQIYYPNAHLELFGSSCNGFVFTGSDMDICLTFVDEKGESFDHAEVIDQLATCLRTHDHLHNILPITTAKVPIVKFNHKKLNVECDISLYNTLAQHNTRMLRTYCKIDQRVQILGYTMKLFAKLCDIGDASRGSLSSYAYILMVLYFLQQRKPPVIPVLQELHPDSESTPEVIVDGWNAWFYSDIENLAKVWPEYGQNKESIAQLWIGLLRFYMEEFNFKEHIVCIRQKALLTRIEKFWNGRVICIEDPFDLNHNLGVGVCRKMSIYIMKAFIRGRELFGKPVEIRNTSLKKFLFDHRKLMVEAPPNDRGCRACGKIGHKVKDCPFRRGTRSTQPNRRQEQPLQQQQPQQQGYVHDRQRMTGRNEMQQRNDMMRAHGKPEGHPPLNMQQSRHLQAILSHLNSRSYAEQPMQHLHQGPPSRKQMAQNIQAHQRHQQQQYRGSPNQNPGGKVQYNDNKPTEMGPTLPIGIHPLSRMPIQPSAPPPPPNWTSPNSRPHIGHQGLAQGPHMPSPPLLDRTPRRENPNPTPPSPIQAMSPPHPMAFFQGQSPYPLSFMTPPPPMGTPPGVHGVLYPPQSARTPPNSMGREDPQVMCRPPAPPPFSHSMWVVNGPSFTQPPPVTLSGNSPSRPTVIPGSQLMGSPQPLLGTSPQQLSGLSPIGAHFQHMALHPENTVNNNNRTLPE